MINRLVTEHSDDMKKKVEHGEPRGKDKCFHCHVTKKTVATCRMLLRTVEPKDILGRLRRTAQSNGVETTSAR